MPHAYQDTVERELEMMLREGVIEPCVSEWASPMIIIKKKDDTIRLYYRRLNPFKFKVIHRGGSEMPTRTPSPGSRFRTKIRREGCERASRSTRAHLDFPYKDTKNIVICLL